MAYKLVGATAIKWYKILGYAGPNVIKQLLKHVNSTKLTKLTDERVPLKIKCKIYSIAKYI